MSRMGYSIEQDAKKLEYGQHVVSGTLAAISKESADTKQQDDSARRNGWASQQGLSNIWNLPPAMQVVLLSATLPCDVLDMTTKFMSDPIWILVKRDEMTLEGRD